MSQTNNHVCTGFLLMKKEINPPPPLYPQISSHPPSWLSLLCPFQFFLGPFVWNVDRKKRNQRQTGKILISFSTITQHDERPDLAANSSAFSLLRSSAARRISSSCSFCRAADSSCPCLLRCFSRSKASRSSLSSRSRCFWATSSNILFCREEKAEVGHGAGHVFQDT